MSDFTKSTQNGGQVHNRKPCWIVRHISKPSRDIVKRGNLIQLCSIPWMQRSFYLMCSACHCVTLINDSLLLVCTDITFQGTPPVRLSRERTLLNLVGDLSKSLSASIKSCRPFIITFITHDRCGGSTACCHIAWHTWQSSSIEICESSMQDLFPCFSTF